MITLNGTTGITTPDVTSDGSLKIDASAPDDSVVVDASGNVGVGTSSFTYNNRLNIKQSTDTGVSAFGLRVERQANDSLCFLGYRDNTNSWQLNASYGSTGAYAPITFHTSDAERARIDSSGSLLVGTTSSSPGGASRSAKITLVHAGGSTTNGINVATTAASSRAVEFQYTGYGVTGFIATGTSTTSYNTSSDYRLKEDWVAVADASTRVNALKPVNFAWKVDGSRVDGFLAHELAEVVPEAVTGEKDAVNAEGNPEYQGIDQSKLVPLLTAALQEALAKIDDLTARVVALEGQP